MPIELKALEDALYSDQKLTPLQIRDKGWLLHTCDKLKKSGILEILLSFAGSF